MPPIPANFLACDLGAESGRVMLGVLDSGKVSLEEIHRFQNTPIRAGESLHWDIDGLISGIKAGLSKAGALGRPITSVSTDSWGVDYVLLGANGEIQPPTFHYRDPRSARGIERMHKLIPWEIIFEETGIQYMPLNTLYQVAAESPERLENAHQLLLIGDAINYLLSGIARAEESLASTTQFYNPRLRSWSHALLSALKVPDRLLPAIVSSGTRLGTLRPDLAVETGLGSIDVIASCSHDTGAAVAAVPAQGDNWAYLSSGTWSLMGAELSQPLIDDKARALNFTNEIGFGGSVRLLKNIVGLWIIQECRRDWAREGLEFDYADLTRLAGEACPFAALINPADPRFLPPGGMPSRIAEFCRETGQTPPESPGATVRCVLESLALFYRRTMVSLEDLLGRRMERLHIVGGGSRNNLLNQFTANALQIPVLAGPVEATALGNVLVQAIALGHLPSLAVARDVVRQSFSVTEITPAGRDEWNDAWSSFQRLLK
jgi:rhamnulokinase